MPLSPRQLKFCQAYASGMTVGVAWRAAGYKAKPKSAAILGGRALQNPEIAAELDRLYAEARERARLTKEDIIDYLCDVVTTPVGKVDQDHKLCQEYHVSETEHGSHTKVKMPAKLDAIKHLSALCGWNAPVKVGFDADDPMLSLLRTIRDRNAPA